jgi:hypothetical protein
MGDGVGLVTDKIVQAVGGVGVDEAVANPLTSADRLVNGSNVLNGCLDTILVGLAVVEAVDVALARVAEDIEVILTGKGDQLSRLGPVNLRNSQSLTLLELSLNTTHVLRINLNSPDQRAALPVEQTNATLALDTKKNTASQTLCLESNIKAATLLLEVFKDLDTGGGLADSVIVAVILRAPSEIQSLAESLVSPSQSGIDNVLAVTADRDEASIRRVGEGLRVDLAGPQVLSRQRERFAILDAGIAALDD